MCRFSVFPEIIFTFDQANQQLNITSRRHGWRGIQKTGRHPQRGKRYSWLPDGLQPVCQHLSPTSGSSSNNLNAYGTTGLNAGAGVCAAIISLASPIAATTVNIRGDFTDLPVPPVTANRFPITLGETDFSSNIFDGFSYTGAR